MEIRTNRAAQRRVDDTIPLPLPRRQRASRVADPAPAVDRIELSAAARTGDDPAARAAQVARLRAQVDAGTYRVDAQRIAQRMVEDDEV